MSEENEWASFINRDDHQKYGNILKDKELISYLNERLYRKYEPTKSPSAHFNDRMNSWINNVDSQEEKVQLHGLIPKIFFVGEEEFNSLYRVAMQEVIIPWVINECDLRFMDDNFKDCLSSEISSTWFCPISDSLRINAFYHVNHISGREYRPDWRSMEKFSSEEKVRSYIVNNSINRIVLLEDFVGSGGQASRILGYIKKLNLDITVLILPLIICPKGNEVIMNLITSYSNVNYKPVLIIPEAEIFNYQKEENEKNLCKIIRNFNEKYHNKIGVDLTVEESERVKIGSYGYRNTGALIVMYSNCPNNTLALIHTENDDWSPLFPRSKRV